MNKDIKYLTVLDFCARLTHNHEIELKALLHGLPPHLLQDGIDAHIAKVAAMALVSLTLWVGVLGFARLGHVAMAQTDL